ncbi:MAG: YceI family protein [Polyangiales bacterium]
MATWNIDSSHSSAQFSIRHLMITNVRGEFSSVTGTVEYDPASPASAKISASIDVATIDTREAQRDTHLKSADFFDVEKFPKITFESTEIVKHGDHLHVKGNLTMHGVTKAIDLEVDGPTKEEKDPWGNTRIGASASAKIDRRDWGLNWNSAIESGGVLVGHDVKLTLDVSLVRK